ncbi:MAG: MgtC/SapB family protein [Burkholderiaceae bacterium]|nr:MgtC/SapB family protein [Burkholderiaceae bacterium]
MAMALKEWLPPEAVDIVLVLFLSLLIGLEREERKAETAGQYAFGGVRTFPLIGLIGYSIAFVANGEVLPQVIGLVIVAAFLLMSYSHKVSVGGMAGITSEMAGVITYVVGALVFHQDLWLATTVSVAAMLLLQMKQALEGLTRRIAPDDIFTFTKFLLLTAVILPAVPNLPFTPFHINPFKSWLVVVAVSSVSYASYVLQRWAHGKGGVILTAALGGAYSSTVTTVVLAKRGARDEQPRLFAGAILMACGTMYLRLAALLAIVNVQLMALLAPALLVLGAGGVGAGLLWARGAGASGKGAAEQTVTANPLELSAALMFAVLFVVMQVATQLAATYLGKSGLYSLAAVMGATDVDPFIMGITQAVQASTALPVAGGAILIAAASNNVFKAGYAWYLARGRTGRQSFLLLLGLASAGLTPLLLL